MYNFNAIGMLNFNGRLNAARKARGKRARGKSVNETDSWNWILQHLSKILQTCPTVLHSLG